MYYIALLLHEMQAFADIRDGELDFAGISLELNVRGKRRSGAKGVAVHFRSCNYICVSNVLEIGY